MKLLRTKEKKLGNVIAFGKREVGNETKPALNI